jgi:putative transposase
MSYRKTSHAVYDLKYHLVWITKYRKPVLRGEIGLRLRELVRQTCATLDVYILSLFSTLLCEVFEGYHW